MAEARPGSAPDERLEQEADALEARIDRLDEHIDEAKDKAKGRAEDAQPLEDAAGDWEHQEGGPQQAEDPTGAEGGRDRPSET